MSTVREREAFWILAATIVVTLVLYAVPYGRTLAYPLVLLSTYAHEMGHGMTAVLVGGAFVSFEMAPDASGMAYLSVPDSRLARGATAAGGLLGPAMLAFAFFLLARRSKTSRKALIGFGALSVLALVLVVRSWFGWLFVGTLAATCLWVGMRARPKHAQLVLAFMAVQLSLSVFSRSDYLFARSAGSSPSDVSQMASSLFLPYWFWGLVVGTLSVIVVGLGARMFIRHRA